MSQEIDDIRQLLEKVNLTEAQWLEKKAEGMFDDDPETADEDSTSWKKLVKRSKDGFIEGTLSNLELLCRTHPHFKNAFAFDTFLSRRIATRDIPFIAKAGETWTETHSIRFRTRLERLYCEPIGRQQAQDLITMLSEDNQYDSLKEWADGLVWDGVPRVDNFFVRYLGAKPGEYATIVSQVGWLSQAARALHVSGCKADIAPILEGPQGCGKSTAISIIGGAYYRELALDVNDKDAKLVLQGACTVELGELETLKRAKEVSALKVFLAVKQDKYRRPYAVDEIEQPRRCVFWGTVNPDGAGYLTDTTGNRRFLPIEVTELDEVALIHDRDQLWAEAISRVKAGAVWWLGKNDTVAAEQAERVSDDPWLEQIRDWLKAEKITEASVNQVMTQCLSIPPERMVGYTRNRVAVCLRLLGWKQDDQRTRRDGQKLRIYRRDIGF